VSEAEATELALRALRQRDRSRRDLDRRLERAGIPAAERDQALDRLADAGLLSDARFAEGRARALVERFAGDELIRCDLEGHGVDEDVIAGVLAELPPEAERAVRAFARRGGDAKALRYLASKGFSAESLERVSADSLH
jgi:regulatory protein